MVKIDSIIPSTIVDSRREPAVSVKLISGSLTTEASVPCGKSKGMFEAFCHTIPRSIEIINEITPKLLDRTFSGQEEFDHFLIETDGTENKENLGVNVTLSLSIAFSRLYSLKSGLNLYNYLGQLADVEKPGFPKLFFNLINGGLHVKEALKPLPFQEYLIVPDEKSPSKATEIAFLFIQELKKNLEKFSGEIHYGDEGGLIVSGDDPEIGLKLLGETLGDLKDKYQGKIDFGLDAASSSLCDGGDEYNWNQVCWTTDELTKLYVKYIENYPILSIEDPFYQDTWNAWAKLNSEVGGKVWVIGDDLTVTNVKRIKKAKETNAINAVLIKPNQIGTVSETIDAVRLVKSYGWKVIVSHRSGETNDSFIADLAYGVAADGLKAGSPLQNERLVKYNRLIEIEKSVQLTNDI